MVQIVFGVVSRFEPPNALEKSGFAAVDYGPFISTPPACSRHDEIPSGSQLCRQKLLNFPALLPQQPTQIQHAWSCLPLVPGRVQPPTISFRLLQPELQQPQQRQQQ